MQRLIFLGHTVLKLLAQSLLSYFVIKAWGPEPFPIDAIVKTERAFVTTRAKAPAICNKILHAPFIPLTRHIFSSINTRYSIRDVCLAALTMGPLCVCLPRLPRHILGPSKSRPPIYNGLFRSAKAGKYDMQQTPPPCSSQVPLSLS